MAFPKRRNLQEQERTNLVIIGSKNPVKISCTEEAFQTTFGDRFLVQGLNVDSGVSEQPIGDEETHKGAYNRAYHSKIAFPEADFWVGIEGGVSEMGEDLIAYAWIVILDKGGKVGRARTASFFLPPIVNKLIHDGMELGLANDKIFNSSNSKQNGGAVGILTKGTMDRKALYTPAVLLACIPFVNGDLFPAKANWR